ncbi:MAG: hypothetical protein IJW31_10100 [Lentisphaeria bacterium]|nr:hypothetical protein [Lentisphaeria bacterium]
MKKLVKKLAIYKLKYHRRASRKTKVLIAFGVVVLLMLFFLTFFQSSFFFCKILLPGICRIYDIEVAADKIDVSFFSPEFQMTNITVKDNKGNNELFIDKIDGSLRKWRLFKNEYYFQKLHFGKVNLKFENIERKSEDMSNGMNLMEELATDKLLETVSDKLFKSLKIEYLSERFPNLIIDDLEIKNFNFQFTYGNKDDLGEVIISNLVLDWTKEASDKIHLVTDGELKIREPYSRIIKNGKLSNDLYLQFNKQTHQYFLQSKTLIDMPEDKEKFICNFTFDSTDLLEGSLCKLNFQSFQAERVTSSVQFDAFWRNKNDFQLKLNEAFLAPEVLKFISELVWGQSFGVFDGKLSGGMISNQDEFIFNFYAKLNRKKDRDWEKMEFTADISSRYNRDSSQLIVSSCYANLLLGDHKLLTLSTPEKYIYHVGDKVEESNFKFDININKFDVKIIDYFCLYDSNMRFIDGLFSADIKSEVLLKEHKILSRIYGNVDRLHSTLYNEDYFEFNGYCDLASSLDLQDWMLNIESKKITFVNNLTENIFIADAAGKGWLDLQKLFCDFQVDIYNGNSRVFDTFAITREYVKNFPYANKFLYSLSCRMEVKNDETMDFVNSCLTVRDPNTDQIFLIAEANPLELESSTEYETNLNPLIVNVRVNDSAGDILGLYQKSLKNLPSLIHCNMVFDSKFVNWQINNFNWRVLDEKQEKIVAEAAADLFMDFDRNYATNINININKSDEYFIERLLGYDLCNLFEGRGHFNIKFFNEFEKGELKSNITLDKVKFLSHPDNIFSASWQGNWGVTNNQLDRFENYFSGKIDDYQVLSMDFHRINLNNRDKMDFDWTINYLDLLSFCEIFSSWKKDDFVRQLDNYLVAEHEKNKSTPTNLFNFSNKISIDCTFDNINYGSANKISSSGRLDCFDNIIRADKINIKINNNIFDCGFMMKAAGENLEIDTKLNAETLSLPLIENISEEDTKKRAIRGELNNVKFDFQTAITSQKNSFLDNLNGHINGDIITLTIPNGMTDSLIGNILVYSFEFAAKLIDLLPTRLTFLQGYINLVTKFNENRYYELLFNEGVFALNCRNGIFEIDKLSLSGEVIDSFNCTGRIGIGTEKFMDIVSTAEIHGIVFPLYFEGTLEEPDVNMSKSIGAFMKNMFDLF